MDDIKKKNINSIFSDEDEEVYTVSLCYKGKKYQRQVGIKILPGAKSVLGGHITRNKKITGRWVWDTRRYDYPVYYQTSRRERTARGTRYIDTEINQELGKFARNIIAQKTAAAQKNAG